MKIEIAKPERMSQSGSSLLRLIQDSDTPALDLFIREAVQNSLDAAAGNEKYVDVEIETGTFNPALLNQKLEGIQDKLNERYPSESADFLAVRDFQTTGLTGPLQYSEVKDGNYGNLLKLVYEISKEQRNQDSGGSWGLGKTVYFRMGIGLVIYYSRIRLDNGTFESRLAACMVEKEDSPNAVIPAYKNFTRRGIAWWGDSVPDEENRTMPVRNGQEINRILSVFSMEPYKDGETGTTIIIPYIDKEKLVFSNKVETGSKNPFWFRSIEDYLETAIKRWYSPRLFNPVYNRTGKEFLRAYVNGKPVNQNEMEPLFKIIQGLYNRSLGIKPTDDYIAAENIEVKEKPIKTLNILVDQVAGIAVTTTVTSEQLGMGMPDHNPKPAVFLGKPVQNEEVNAPIVFFTRKPGMIVEYETEGPWTTGVMNTPEGNYQLVLFRLNSDNILKNTEDQLTLEEYIRQGEGANHRSWKDYSTKEINPRVVYKIQRNMANWLNTENSPKEDKQSGDRNTALGRRIAKFLMRDSSGNGSTKPVIVPPGNSENPPKLSGLSFRIGTNPEQILYQNGKILVSGFLRAGKPVEKAAFEIGIQTSSGIISFESWEKDFGTKPPVSISRIELTVNSIDSDKINESIELGLFRKSADISGRMEAILKEDSRGLIEGVIVKCNTSSEFQIDITVEIKIDRMDIKPVFRLVK